MKIIFGAQAYNLFNHPNFAVPSNTQSPLTLGGSGEAVFQYAARDLAKNVGRIFTTVGTGRQSKDSTLESKACVKLLRRKHYSTLCLKGFKTATSKCAKSRSFRVATVRP
jgi:hypothetical protein